MQIEPEFHNVTPLNAANKNQCKPWHHLLNIVCQFYQRYIFTVCISCIIDFFQFNTGGDKMALILRGNHSGFKRLIYEQDFLKTSQNRFDWTCLLCLKGLTTVKRLFCDHFVFQQLSQVSRKTFMQNHSHSKSRKELFTYEELCKDFLTVETFTIFKTSRTTSVGRGIKNEHKMLISYENSSWFSSLCRITVFHEASIQIVFH